MPYHCLLSMWPRRADIKMMQNIHFVIPGSSYSTPIIQGLKENKPSAHEAIYLSGLSHSIDLKVRTIWQQICLSYRCWPLVCSMYNLKHLCWLSMISKCNRAMVIIVACSTAVLQFLFSLIHPIVQEFWKLNPKWYLKNHLMTFCIDRLTSDIWKSPNWWAASKSLASRSPSLEKASKASKASATRNAMRCGPPLRSPAQRPNKSPAQRGCAIRHNVLFDVFL